MGPGGRCCSVQGRAVSQTSANPCLSVRPLTLGSQSRSGIDDDVAVTYLLLDCEGGGRVLLFVAWRRANRVGSYLGEGTRAANNASSHTTDGSHALSNALSLSLSFSLSPTLEPPTHTPHATLTHYEITRKRRTLFPCFVLHTPRPPLVRTSLYSTRAPRTPSFSSQKTEEILPPNCTIGAISIRIRYAISMRLKKLEKIEKEERKRKRRRHRGGRGGRW